MNDPGSYDPPPPIDAPPPPPPQPPGPPSYGAPPPGGGAAVAVFPWEDRQNRGFFPALIDSIKMLVTSPGEAYDRIAEKGDYLSPILFAVIIGWVMAIIAQIWSALFQDVWLNFMPPEFQEGFASSTTEGAMGIVAMMLLAPLMILAGLFISSGIVHLFLMMVGGLKDSSAGFEGTVRALGYAYVSSLAQVIPVGGGMIALVWSIILQIIGISRLHRTSTGKAAAAVLLPIVLCCVCAIVLVVVFIGSIGAALSGIE